MHTPQDRAEAYFIGDPGDAAVGSLLRGHVVKGENDARRQEKAEESEGYPAETVGVADPLGDGASQDSPVGGVKPEAAREGVEKTVDHTGTLT